MARRNRWLSPRFILSCLAASFWIAVAVFAPWLAPHDPLDMDFGARLVFSSPEHWLGTDQYGRDILSRLVWGARPSLMVAIGVVAFAGTIGTLIGVTGGYLRGWSEIVIMRAADVLLCFPPIVLGAVIVGFVGPGIPSLIATIGLVYTPQFARLAFTSTMRIRSQLFIESARALGASHATMLFRHILPNILPVLIVQATLTAAFAVLLESGLSFLGLGVQAPAPSWGAMLAESRGYLAHNPGFTIWPSVAIASAILSFNVLGDTLRDNLDPRLRGL